jgi:hypothetical protein
MDERKIKFRVWDTNGKYMIAWGELNPIADLDEVLNHEYTNLIPMQFTGLKDKNGKEIYEGDIVICDKFENHEQYQVVIEDIRDLPRELFGSNLNWREVIGNIYENPDKLRVSVFIPKDERGKEKARWEKYKKELRCKFKEQCMTEKELKLFDEIMEGDV